MPVTPQSSASMSAIASLSAFLSSSVRVRPCDVQGLQQSFGGGYQRLSLHILDDIQFFAVKLCGPDQQATGDQRDVQSGCSMVLLLEGGRGRQNSDHSATAECRLRAGDLQPCAGARPSESPARGEARSPQRIRNLRGRSAPRADVGRHARRPVVNRGERQSVQQSDHDAAVKASPAPTVSTTATDDPDRSLHSPVLATSSEPAAPRVKATRLRENRSHNCCRTWR